MLLKFTQRPIKREPVIERDFKENIKNADTFHKSDNLFKKTNLKGIKQKIYKHYRLIFILFCTLFYFGTGIYLSRLNNITIDEFYHFGASNLYAHGLGGNNEHPFLLKWILSLNLHNLPSDIFTPQEDYGSTLTAIQNSGFNKFYESRILVLIFNFIPIIYLFSLFFKTKIIKHQDKILLFFLSFLIFSPSFYSHNYLITFDVSATLYAFCTAVSGVFFYKNLTEKTNENKSLFKNTNIINFSIFTFFITIAVNVKFSNIILIFLPVIGLILSSFENKRVFKRAVLASAIGGTLTLLLTSLLSYLAFKNIPISTYPLNIGNYAFNYPAPLSKFEKLKHYSPAFLHTLFDGIFIYYRGLLMSLFRSKDISDALIYGEYSKTNFLFYSLKVYLFKETLVVIFTSLLVLFFTFKKFVNSPENLYLKVNRRKILLTIFFVFTPFVYAFFALQSQLLIGYRHFYTVLIFVYFALAVAFIMQNKDKILFKTLLFLIPIFGFLGIPQNINYLNDLAFNKTYYFNDSTYNWGQRSVSAVQYALDTQILNKENAKNWANYTFLTPNTETTWKLYFPEKSDIATKISLNGANNNLNTTKLEDTSINYLIIDSELYQRLLYSNDSKNTNSPHYKNAKFIKEKGSVLYSVPNLIYVIKLDKEI